MKLIADVGGTSSRWLNVDQGMASLVKLKGFNPVADRGTGFIQGLEQLTPNEVDHLTIYCAGCGTEERQAQVKALAAHVFSNAAIVVHSDLLAVARAFLGTTSGMAAILGTGMNVAYYDGNQLIQRVPSLGYLMGDEGSGADIGRQFLKDLFNRRIPIELIVKVFPNGNPGLGATIKEVYGNEAQNRAMASYAGLLATAQDHAYVQELVGEAFKRFSALIKEHHQEGELQRISVSGGIAAGFQVLLEKELKHTGFEEVAVAADPLEGLLTYHQTLD